MKRFDLLSGIAVSALAIGATVVNAGTTYTGSGGWTDGPSWTAGIPGNGADVIIANNVTFNSSAAFHGNSFASLEIQPSVALVVSDNMTVTSTTVGASTGSTAALFILGNAEFEAVETMLVDVVGAVQVGLGASAGNLKLTGSSSFTGLALDAGAIINVAANSTVEFDSTSGPFNAEIKGSITLSASASRILISEDTEFDYVSSPGLIQLGNMTAEIFIAVDKTLTNKIDLQGIGVIEGGVDFVNPNGVLKNEGMVVANGNGDLVLRPDLVLDDTSSSFWGASGSNATLLFLENATGLQGYFGADNEGTIEIGDGIEIVTTGDAHVDEDSAILLGNAADMEVDDLTGEVNGEVIACGDQTFFRVVNGTPSTSDFASPLNDNRFLFDGTNSGSNQNNCP